MKKHRLLILLIATIHCVALGQQQDTTKEQLKKKYENTDIYQETKKKLQSNNIYPDSIILAPLHFVDTYVKLDTAEFEFKSLSVDVDVQTEIPDDYNLYICIADATINKMQFYCGMQTHSGGKPINGGGDIGIGRGGIFSRWLERNKGALKTTGYYDSSDGEGDFIGVRNKFKWNKGLYRIKLFKSGYVPGKPVAENFMDKDLMFAWSDYEHSWVTMEIEDLRSHHKVTIGSLAFPGKKLMYSKANFNFLEQYGMAINFAKQKPPFMYPVINYKQLPVVKLSMGNMMINSHKRKLLDVQSVYNATHHADQSKIPMPIPLLSKATYDDKTGTIQFETGSFQSWVTPGQE
ncbi:hypothetical protein FO440_11710 [Mucilaginibacter corticis]|uniref:DUF4861 domain-containing protein n=1 Tax=Mucilaginibacter corticis TaxID=2597670 RepID=A0A556MKH5_9SPHI|nr:hypothetical protein [Mucilaginibacter corticis]TSJ40418.1 hypothetical protein FO440_11710 [Mucilaginibacter corticis]